MRESMKRIGTLWSRNVKEILRDPLSLGLSLGMPLLMEILFYFIFHKLTAQFEMKYLAPGIVVFSQAFLCLFTGLLIALDRSSAFLTRLYVTKTRPCEFIFGYALALLPVCGLQSVLFFLVGGAIEPSTFSAGMAYSVFLSFVSGAFFIGMGILLGSVCNEKSLGGVASVVIAGQSVLSGMWFPKEGMSEGFLLFMRCLPFKNATDLVQNASAGVFTFPDFVQPLLIVLSYTFATFFVAVFAFRAKMKEK